MYKDISSYGLIGDMHAVALVSGDGSIDYCSMPHIDSPTVFASLLDDEKGGLFKIQPKNHFKSEQVYIKDTNILSCTFDTETGKAQLIDFMPVSSEELFDKKDHVIHRCLKVTSGNMDFILEFSPRPQYAKGLPKITKENDAFKVRLKGEIFTLTLKLREYEIKEMGNAGLIVQFSLKQDESAHFDFIYGDIKLEETGDCAFEETGKYWLDWISSCVGEKCLFWAEYNDMINRSLLVLKLLTFQPTGAIAAAATTSLPESVGSERNWDYRFTWLRDASFTLKAMFALGHVREADSFIRWLHTTYKRYRSRNLQIMYSLEGESKLIEIILSHLKGYRDSRPVRIGNGAFKQNQWDIYGEVMDSALRLSDYAGRIDEALWPFFMDICNLAARDWKEPDEGIWEVRNGKSHFVYSKVMCWVALDRGIKIAERYGFSAPLDGWREERDVIKEDVLQKGYDKTLNSFVQQYGSKDLDSSLLLLGLMNFLPIDDRRMQGTIDACKKNLMKNDFLLRYMSDDGLKGEEGGFLLCNFWLIECLALSGKIDEARGLLAKTIKAGNHLGLFSEEYDFKNKEMLGNFPQAFSHIGYINAVSAILNIQNKLSQHKIYTPLVNQMQKLIPSRVVLNKSDREATKAGRDIAAQLKISLNNLQGAFFDALEGRVNYEALKKSGNFKTYLTLAEKLNAFNPFSLKTDEEKKAFWINVYNILIVHGVVHFDVRKSVREVFNFFGRIYYAIGGLDFSPDDIEHGILRGNRPHPGSGRKQYMPFDKRKALCVRNFDNRIHFALVCASSSCPPIEFYDEAKIDSQLDLAAKSFINRRGLILDESRTIVHLSQIFKWYGLDFGRNEKDVMVRAATFTDEKIKKYVLENKDKIKIKYLPYDWNLNRSLK